MKSEPKPVVVPVSDRVPPVRHRVIVVCRDFRCLGYRDREGQWRDDTHNTELHEVIGWMEIWSNGTAGNNDIAGNAVRTQAP